MFMYITTLLKIIIAMQAALLDTEMMGLLRTVQRLLEFAQYTIRTFFPFLLKIQNDTH